MLLNILINYYVFKELICQDRYKKIKLEQKDKNVRSANIASFVKIQKNSNIMLRPENGTLRKKSFQNLGHETLWYAPVVRRSYNVK